jgi:hypothetical protein
MCGLEAKSVQTCRQGNKAFSHTMEGLSRVSIDNWRWQAPHKVQYMYCQHSVPCRAAIAATMCVVCAECHDGKYSGVGCGAV